MRARLDLPDRAAFVAAFGGLFEHSPWVAEETYGRGPFRTAEQLQAALCSTLRAAGPERQRGVMHAHPDLAGRLARQRRLTAASSGEQASAGLDKLTEAEKASFQKLNDAYRARFGIPFIICARLNDKKAILKAMQERMNHSPAEEHEAALVEIEKIAWLRLQDALK